MNPPTERQLSVLRVIADRHARALPPPTHREICAAIGLRSAHTVACHLVRLETKGLVRLPSGGKTRQILITELGKKLAGVFYDPRPPLLESLYRACIAFGNGQVSQQVVLDAADAIRQHDAPDTHSRHGVGTFDSCREHQVAAPLSIVEAGPRHSSGAP